MAVDGRSRQPARAQRNTARVTREGSTAPQSMGNALTKSLGEGGGRCGRTVLLQGGGQRGAVVDVDDDEAARHGSAGARKQGGDEASRRPSRV